jgi:hypothetical protein
MSPFIDQRASKRVPFRQQVKVVSVGRMVAYAMATNIGVGGVLLSASSPLPVGSQCQVAIPVPGSGEMERILAEGTVVRSDATGTAVRFSKNLESSRIDTLLRPVGTPWSALVASYKAYFQVSRNQDLAGCEKLLGVSKQTFRTSFYISFASCISIAILSVWLLRNSIPAAPNWIKIALSFVYGAVWLGVIQPAIDLTVFHFLKHRHSHGSHA